MPVPLIALVAAILISSALAYGFNLYKEWLETQAYYSTTFETINEILPSDKISIFDTLTIKAKIRAKIDVFNYAKMAFEPMYLDFISGKVYCEFPGTYTESRVELTSQLGEGQTTLPITLPAGTRIMNIHYENCVFRHPIYGILKPYSCVNSIPITIEKPKGKIDIEITPKTPKVGDIIIINGKVTLEKITLKDIEAFAKDSSVYAYLDGKEIAKTPIDIDTQTFTLRFKATETGTHTLAFEVKPVETYAYIGVWASLSLTYTTTGEITITPTTVTIKSISPQPICEGDAIAVNAFTSPMKSIILYYDNVARDRKISDSQGYVTLMIPSEFVKAGTHEIRLEIEGIKESITSETVTVLEKPKVAAPMVEVSFTLRDKNLIGGGEYITFIDAIERAPEGDKYVPFELTSEVGDYATHTYNCIRGRLAIHYKFPRGKYPSNFYVPIYESITVKGKIYKKTGEVRLG